MILGRFELEFGIIIPSHSIYVTGICRILFTILNTVFCAYIKELWHSCHIYFLLGPFYLFLVGFHLCVVYIM